MPIEAKKVPPVKDPAVTAEEMADAIRRISDGMKDVLHAGLNRRALLVLLRDASGIAMSDIAKVLDGLESLARHYTTKRGRA